MDIVEKFLMTIKNDEKRKKLRNSCYCDQDTIKLAIDLAYNDAKRTLKGINEDMRNAAKDALAIEFQKFFLETPKDQKDFDQKHNTMCVIWYEKFPTDNLQQYGKAQKIVNMTFKYLYCCNKCDKDKQAYFKYCHMPLDSYILEWYCREIGKKREDIKIRDISLWSKMEQNQYKDIQESIIEYCNKQPKEYWKTPLELEFEVWPQIKLKLAAEAFLFAANDELTQKQRNEIKEDEFNSNLDQIKDIVKKLLNSHESI